MADIQTAVEILQRVTNSVCPGPWAGLITPGPRAGAKQFIALITRLITHSTDPPPCRPLQRQIMRGFVITRR